MDNLITLIPINIFLIYLFYIVISRKWIPSKNMLISFLIGCCLVPIAFLSEKGISLLPFISNNENLNIGFFVLIEEFLKLLSVFLIFYFVKDKKVSFVELLGVGVGFALVENIMFGLNAGTGLYSGLLNTGLLTNLLRTTGSLILHTITVGLFALFLVYKTNKKILYLIPIIFSVIFHYLFNYKIMIGDGENFLGLFSIYWLLFLILYFIHLYFENKDTLNIKEILKKCLIFFIKFVVFIALVMFSLGIVSEYGNQLGIKDYSQKEIESAQNRQVEIEKAVDNWNPENLSDGYKKYPKESSQIYENLIIINNQYKNIIYIMENEPKSFTSDYLEFLKTGGGELATKTDELAINLYVKVAIDRYKLSVKKISENYYNSELFFNKFGFKNIEIKQTYSEYKNISDIVISNMNQLISLYNSDKTKNKDDLLSNIKEIDQQYENLNNQIDLLNKLIEANYNL